jgi:hypothetical protein
MNNYQDLSYGKIGYKELVIKHLDRLSILTSRVFSDFGEESSSSVSEDNRINGMAWGIEFLMAILPKDVFDKIQLPTKKNGEEKYVFLCKKIRIIMNECEFIYEDNSPNTDEI